MPRLAYFGCQLRQPGNAAGQLRCPACVTLSVFLLAE